MNSVSSRAVASGHMHYLGFAASMRRKSRTCALGSRPGNIRLQEQGELVEAILQSLERNEACDDVIFLRVSTEFHDRLDELGHCNAAAAIGVEGVKHAGGVVHVHIEIFHDLLHDVVIHDVHELILSQAESPALGGLQLAQRAVPFALCVRLVYLLDPGQQLLQLALHEFSLILAGILPLDVVVLESGNRTVDENGRDNVEQAKDDEDHEDDEHHPERRAVSRAERDGERLPGPRAVVAKHEPEGGEHRHGHGREEFLAIDVVRRALGVVPLGQLVAVTAASSENKILALDGPQHQAED
mmetsp:Transcript_97138/g.279601  ORF Transcript_97138/g.279601 Transcript_97138/m.279601 type:complete len:299 (+) Transcript_97138:290-1186(+)